MRVAPLADSVSAEQSSIVSTAIAFTMRLLLRIWRRYFASDSVSLKDSIYRRPRLLSAAANLLGICILIIGGLKLSRLDSRTYSDEVAWLSAVFVVVSIFLSYLSTRADTERHWQSRIANWSFFLGIDALIVSMVIAAWQL